MPTKKRRRKKAAPHKVGKGIVIKNSEKTTNATLGPDGKAGKVIRNGPSNGFKPIEEDDLPFKTTLVMSKFRSCERWPSVEKTMKPIKKMVKTFNKHTNRASLEWIKKMNKIKSLNLVDDCLVLTWWNDCFPCCIWPSISKCPESNRWNENRVRRQTTKPAVWLFLPR